MANLLSPSQILPLALTLLPPASASEEIQGSPILRSSIELLALTTHAVHTALDFRLTSPVSSSSSTSASLRRGSEEGSGSPAPGGAIKNQLPKGWNAGGSAKFEYRHDQSSLKFVISVTELGGRGVIAAVAVEDHRSRNFDILLSDYISTSSFPFTLPPSSSTPSSPTSPIESNILSTLFTGPNRMNDLISLYRINILQPLIPRLRKEGYSELSDSTSSSSSQSTSQSNTNIPGRSGSSGSGSGSGSGVGSGGGVGPGTTGGGVGGRGPYYPDVGGPLGPYGPYGGGSGGGGFGGIIPGRPGRGDRDPFAGGIGGGTGGVGGGGGGGRGRGGMFGGGPGNPFNIGGSDLDPLGGAGPPRFPGFPGSAGPSFGPMGSGGGGGRGGDGMYVGPDHPLFRDRFGNDGTIGEGGTAGGGGGDRRWGGDGYLPSGAVPPGARFDPVGPNTSGSLQSGGTRFGRGGHGQGIGSSGNPTPDAGRGSGPLGSGRRDPDWGGDDENERGEEGSLAALVPPPPNDYDAMFG